MQPVRAGTSGSGQTTARVFHALLALVCADAFLSLGSQILILIGSRGLLPLAELLSRLRDAGVGLLEFPTLFRWAPNDAALAAGSWIGLLLATLAGLGVGARACFAAIALLYLSYATACREFLSFQWDNLLIECALLAALLPRDRRSPWIHFLFRVLVFKLYFESGIAKWQSQLGDWLDGSAMTFYYETAPIPTALAWYLHQLPRPWHLLESRAVLAGELLLPFGIFAPRPLRLVALVGLSGFQLLNLLSANYGFFCWLALALHVFLLADRDFERVRALLARRLPALVAGAGDEPLAAKPVRTQPGVVLFAVLYLGISTVDALWSFGDSPAFEQATAPLRAAFAPLRVANTYHLFGHVTRERVEPEFQTLVGEEWVTQPMHYKPGPVDRAPPFVAPHQPRVDFRLWFYGLAFERGMPEYVFALLIRLCRDPAAVQPLFASSLPEAPRASRVAFRRYGFTTEEQGQRSGEWWTRRFVGATRPLRCDSETPLEEAPP